MSTIDIRTTQNVTIEYELAPLRERYFAFFIDAIIVFIAYYAVALLFTMAMQDESWNDGMLFGVVYGLLPVIAFMMYHFFSEILADGQSWGKKALGLKVVRLDGEEPGLTDYLLRAVLHIIDSIFSIGVIASFLISSSVRNQRLGDLAANTSVIRVRHNSRFKLEDILNINSLENYEPQYPDVQQFSEEDMLLIKNVVTRYRTYRNKAHAEAIDQLVNRVSGLLDIEQPPADKIEFLKTLIRDYIVLTR
ncbi:MAG: RDD family protein [Saprospiraceae bacterium]|nr:RDD family protein [Saprospiraceae bacterium]